MEDRIPTLDEIQAIMDQMAKDGALVKNDDGSFSMTDKGAEAVEAMMKPEERERYRAKRLAKKATKTKAPQE